MHAYCHGQEARLVVRENKVLVGELVRAVDGAGARAVAIDEVASLDHEALDLQTSVPACRTVDSGQWTGCGMAAGESGPGVWVTDDTVKLAGLVALRLAAVVLCLACAELAKVLGRLGDNVSVQLHLDAAQLLPYCCVSAFLAGRWGKRGVGSGAPPKVMSKKTIGLSSVASAMAAGTAQVSTRRAGQNGTGRRRQGSAATGSAGSGRDERADSRLVGANNKLTLASWGEGARLVGEGGVRAYRKVPNLVPSTAAGAEASRAGAGDAHDTQSAHPVLALPLAWPETVSQSSLRLAVGFRGREGEHGGLGLWVGRGQRTGLAGWTLDAGRWTLDAGRWTLDAGRWTLDAGRWTLDAGRWVLAARCSTLHTANGAPRTHSGTNCCSGQDACTKSPAPWPYCSRYSAAPRPGGLKYRPAATDAWGQPPSLSLASAPAALAALVSPVRPAQPLLPPRPWFLPPTTTAHGSAPPPTWIRPARHPPARPPVAAWPTRTSSAVASHHRDTWLSRDAGLLRRRLWSRSARRPS